MASNKTVATRRLNRSGKVMLLLFLAGTAFTQLIGPSGSCAVCFPGETTLQESPDDQSVQLTRARELANSTKKTYESLKRLSGKGSVSQRTLRRADVQRKIALLDYSSLLDPSRGEKNLALKAEVILQYRSRELAVMKELYSRGSISEVDYLRTVAARDVAVANHNAVMSTSETQRKLQAIKAAKAKQIVAQKEFEIAKRLFQSQAISQIAFDRAQANLRIANAELDGTRESLGARAVQVQQ